MGKSIYTIKLESMEEKKDLKVLTRSDLESSTQCVESAAKARRKVDLLGETFEYLMKKTGLLNKTCEHSLPDYRVQSWSPHIVKGIAVLE